MGARRTLGAVGMAVATGGAVPTARAELGFDATLCLSFHFGRSGEPGYPGLGLEGRMLSPVEEDGSGITGGIGARVALVGWDQLRLLVTPQLVRVVDNASIGLELGLGTRLGRERGLLMEGAVRGDYGYGHMRMAVAARDAGRWSLSVGARAPQVDGMPTSPGPYTGRPLRDDRGGRAALPAVCLLDRDFEGRRWAERARMEWASVPAFGELHEQLRACGAPAELQARALAAADDELRHAVDAAHMATLLTGAPVALDPPARSRRRALGGRDGLERLVGESWSDGCLGEGTAAHEARLEADTAPSPVRPVLRRVAEDEQRHAELAWDVLRFACAANPTTTRTWLMDAAAPVTAISDWHREAQQRLAALLTG